MTLAAKPQATPPSERKETPLSPRVLGLYTDRYLAEDGKQASLTVSLQGNHLQLLQDGPGHKPSTLFRDYGDLDFYFGDGEADLEFSGEGKLVLFDLRSNQAIFFHRDTP